MDPYGPPLRDGHAASRRGHAVAPCYRPLCNFAFSLFSRLRENRKERYGYAAFGGSADGRFGVPLKFNSGIGVVPLRFNSHIGLIVS